MSARWWSVVSVLLVVLLLLLIGVLAFLNTTRLSGRSPNTSPAVAAPQLPLGSPSPAAGTAALVVPSPIAENLTPTTPTPVSTQTAQLPIPTQPADARSARIANTDGRGANLRREPSATAPLVAAVAENAQVRLLGSEQRGADGRLWQQVEDGRGNQGWVPVDLLVDAR